MSRELKNVETAFNTVPAKNSFNKKVLLAFVCLFTITISSFSYFAIKASEKAEQENVVAQKKGDSKFGSLFLWGKAFGMLPTIVK